MRFRRRVRPLVGSHLALFCACTLDTYGISDSQGGATTTSKGSESTGSTPTSSATSTGSTETTGDVTSAASDTTAGPDEGGCGAPAPGESGSLIRLVKFSGARSQVLHGAALDPQGNIYVVGQFDRELLLDGSTMATSDTQVPFVYKFCPDGKLQWARHGQSTDLALEEYKPEQYRLAIAADAGGAYITGRLRGSVSFSTVSLKPSMPEAAFVVSFDADGQPLKGVLLNAEAAAGMDIAVDGDEVFVAGMCYAPTPLKPTGILLSKFNTSLSLPEESHCVGGGSGELGRNTTARSLTLRPGEPTMILGGTVLIPEDPTAAAEWGPCDGGVVNNRHGFVAEVSRDPADWASAETRWNWCRVFGSESNNEVVLDTAVSDQKILTALATGGSAEALGTCGMVSPAELPGGLSFAWAALDGGGSCTHAEWFPTIWGSGYLFGVEPAGPSEFYLAGRFDKTIDIRNLQLTSLNQTFFAARLPLSLSSQVTWHVRAKHTSDTQKSGATYVTANDSAVVFLGYARGIGELAVGEDSVEVGTDDEHQGASKQAYDSFLLLVRP
ncbi:hypothetical protein [Nannocystis bainbridge]|uniref:Uncharacterized protein n=1 Tax=Nannocystis bainbridge TaxID=2995303 RepID=A0ABT5E503_9BACT|nr:hypothetical protein [Nannocystis bainbridge]MDC0720485.1 hypothetical protein [Nannocystis bainbridge]